MKNSILILFVLTAFIGCKSKSASVETKNQTEVTTQEDSIILRSVTITQTVGGLVKDSPPIAPTKISKGDPYQIHTVEIKNNVLWIDVSYGGGCKDHEFQMFYAISNVDRTDNDDLPYQILERRLTLTHNANKDRCRSIVREKLRFDLSNVKSDELKELELYLTGWSKTLVYQY
jgi:hypothetical protein